MMRSRLSVVCLCLSLVAAEARAQTEVAQKSEAHNG